MPSSSQPAFVAPLPFSRPRQPPPSQCTLSRRVSTICATVSNNHLSFDPTVYFVADARVAAGADLNALAKAAIAGGARAVQFRDKAGGADLVSRAQALRDAVRAAHADAVFIVNDDPLLARDVGADGVHVGQDDAALGEVRRVVGEDAVVGVSVGTADEAGIAIAGGADYLGVGPVYGTSSKVDAGEALGLTELAKIVRAVDGRVPVVAIGGISMGNCGGCAVVGADGVAVISAIVNAKDPERSARELYERFECAHHDREAGGRPPVPGVMNLDLKATSST